MDARDRAAQGLTHGLACLAAAASLAACAHAPRVFGMRDPLTAHEHAQLGAAYEAQGRGAEAAHQYRLAVLSDPRHAEAWLALGNRAFEDGDLKTARRAFLRVRALAPGHPGAGNNLAMTYLALEKKLDLAEALAKDALARGGPLQPYVYDTLARIYFRQGRYREALEALDAGQEALADDDAPVREALLQTRAALEAARRGMDEL